MDDTTDSEIMPFTEPLQHLPPEIQQLQRETRNSIEGKPMEEQLIILDGDFTRLVQIGSDMEDRLFAMYCVVKEEAIYTARHDSERVWIASIPGLGQMLRRGSRRMVETARLSKKLFERWGVWPWELIDATYRPQAWSRGLLEALVKMSYVTADVSQARDKLKSSIQTRSSRSCAQHQPGLSRQAVLVLHDVQHASSSFHEDHTAIDAAPKDRGTGKRPAALLASDNLEGTQRSTSPQAQESPANDPSASSPHPRTQATKRQKYLKPRVKSKPMDVMEYGTGTPEKPRSRALSIDSLDLANDSPMDGLGSIETKTPDWIIGGEDQSDDVIEQVSGFEIEEWSQGNDAPDDLPFDQPTRPPYFPEIPLNTLEGSMTSLQSGRWVSTTAIDELMQRIPCRAAKVYDAAYMEADDPELMARKSVKKRPEPLCLFPTNHNGDHWTLVVIDFALADISLYNSLADYSCQSVAEGAASDWLALLADGLPAHQESLQTSAASAQIAAFIEEHETTTLNDTAQLQGMFDASQEVIHLASHQYSLATDVSNTLTALLVEIRECANASRDRGTKLQTALDDYTSMFNHFKTLDTQHHAVKDALQTSLDQDQRALLKENEQQRLLSQSEQGWEAGLVVCRTEQRSQEERMHSAKAVMEKIVGQLEVVERRLFAEAQSVKEMRLDWIKKLQT
ncbi:MAG: hypothetical protein Q9220_006164 [cf. Caloplaca sp. 1 TL-2023]